MHVYVWWGCNQLVDKTVKVDVEAITASARKVHVFECECACSSANARVRVRMRVHKLDSKLCAYELCACELYITHAHMYLHAR